MKLVVDSRQMKEIDSYTIEQIGIPSMVLMERAAFSVVEYMKHHISQGNRILSVCGCGNNGADGIAVARILHLLGFQADVLLLCEEKDCTVECKEQLKIIKNLGVKIYNNINTCEYTIIVDAILGIGLKRPVEGIYKLIIDKINEEDHIVFSVDIPSGLSCDTGKPMGTAIKADYTITFGLMKQGLLLHSGREYGGTVIVADIGFPQKAMEEVKPNVYTYEKSEDIILPRRTPYSNKGTYGKVLVIAGSDTMTGAAFLSAKACYRSGTGVVKVLTSPTCVNVVRTLLPEAIYSPISYDVWNEEAENLVKKELTWADAVVLGPGIGIGEFTKRLVDCIIENCKIPLVLDADGLNILGNKMDEGQIESSEERFKFLYETLPNPSILTPHLKELEVLLRIPTKVISENLIEVAKMCKNSSLTMVLKDACTIVTHEGKLYMNQSGNDGMATAGSGDVLTGIISAFLAGGLLPFHAAASGVYVHGMAGDAGMKKKGRFSLMASDIIDHISEILIEKKF